MNFQNRASHWGSVFQGRSSIYCYHSRLPNSLPAMKSQKQLSLAIREREIGQVLTSGTGFNGVSCLLPTLCTVPHHNVFGRIRYNDLWAGRLVLDRRNATASRSS